MKTFRDNAGRVWNVAIDANAVREVRSRLDINLLSLPERDFELLTRLTTDLVLLVDVLFVVCRRQAEQLSVSDEQFGEAMYGDAIGEATNALVREVIDFFPDARRRQTLGKVIDKGEALGNLLLDRATAKLPELDNLNLEKIADQILATGMSSAASGLGNSSSNAPGSVASTPAR